MTTPGGDTGDDLISGLTDDLLVHILDLLPETRDAVRTHALSRRWRGLWTGVPALCFNSECAPEVLCTAGVAERYLAFVNDALALRATEKSHSIKDLEIVFNISGQRTLELVPVSFQAVQGWIHYAVENEVKSLVLDLDVPWNYTERTVISLDDELVTSANKLETMHLRLGYAELGLFSSSSSTWMFMSLTDLSLEGITIAGNLLCRLVSSPCCPGLRKLYLSDIRFPVMEELTLETDKLLELSMGMMMDMRSLELRTPSLRVLCVEDCVDLERFKVSAPKLHDLMFWVQQRLHIDDVHGHLSSVATLKIQLSSHRDLINYEDNNDGSFHVLKRCRLTKCLEVSLDVVETKYRRGGIMKRRIRSLTHVTSLTLHVTLREPHFFGSGIGSFLVQCSSIRYLSLQLCYWITKEDLSEHDPLCENSCQWKPRQFSLAHLQKVEFKKLIGTDWELQFIQSILKREIRVQKVGISFDPHYWIKDNKDAFQLMPPLDGGSWTTCNDADLSYKWRRYCV